MKQTTHPVRHHASADAYELHLFGSWRNAQYARRHGLEGSKHTWATISIGEGWSNITEDAKSCEMPPLHYQIEISPLPFQKTSHPIAWLFLCSTKSSNHHFLQKAWVVFFFRKKSNPPGRSTPWKCGDFFFRPRLLFTQVAHWLRPHMRNTCLPHPWSDPIRRHSVDHSRCLRGKVSQMVIV